MARAAISSPHGIHRDGANLCYRKGLVSKSIDNLTLALSLILLRGSAKAQGQTANRLDRVSATVVKLDGQMLTLKAASGKDVSVTLPANARVLRSRSGAIADVKPGEFIGCTAVEGPDGKLRPKEIHILPEPLRGVGEGHYPWGVRGKNHDDQWQYRTGCRYHTRR